jgi:excisionase family DNA binding protein
MSTGLNDEDFASEPHGDEDSEVCSTSKAAKILGVSNTTIQIMVERGELDAWRTRGGHRRISVASIERLKALRSQRGQRRTDPGQLDVLLVEDDVALRTLYQHTISSWNLPVQVSVAANGMEALLLIERKRPDLLITDLFMEPVDGFQLMRMLREHREFDDMVIIVITGLSDADLDARGGLPKGVVVYRKPVPFEKLQGFVESSLTRKQLTAR